MEYPLNIRKMLDLLPENNVNLNSLNLLPYIQAHKGTSVTARITEITVDYEYKANEELQISPGIRIQVRLDPGNHYELRVRASLLRGDRGFIYCEDSNNIRLIPRTHLITPETRNQTFIIEFTANTEKNWIGILFFDGAKDYSLLIEKFVVREIRSRNENAPQGPVLTKLLPSTSSLRCLPILAESKIFSQTPIEEDASSFLGQRHSIHPGLGDTKQIGLIDQLRQSNVIYMIDGFIKKIPRLLDDPDPNISSVSFSFKGSLEKVPRLLVLSWTVRSDSDLKLLSHSNSHLGRIGKISNFSEIVKYIQIPYELEGDWIDKLYMSDYKINRCPDYGSMTSLLGLLPILKEPVWLLLDMSPDLDLHLIDYRKYIASEKADLAHREGRIEIIDALKKLILLPSSFLDIDIYLPLQDGIIKEFDGFELLLCYLRSPRRISLGKLDDDLEMTTKLNFILNKLKKKGIWTQAQDLAIVESKTVQTKLAETRTVTEKGTGTGAGTVTEKGTETAGITEKGTETAEKGTEKGTETAGITEKGTETAEKGTEEGTETAGITEKGTETAEKGTEKGKEGQVHDERHIQTESEDNAKYESGILLKTEREPSTALDESENILVNTSGEFCSEKSIMEEETEKPIKRHAAINGPPLNGDRVAVIIELKAEIHLINSVAHFLRRLDRSWVIQIFHGIKNERSLKESKILKSYIESKEIVLTNLKRTSMTRGEYSRLLLSESFYKSCLGKTNAHILILKIGSYLNDNPIRAISSFFKYDYLGATFPNTVNSLLNRDTKLLIGSGNFSLRKKSRMIEICSLLKQHRFKHLLGKNEDLVISSFLATPIVKSVRLPTIDEISLFSTESTYLPGSIGGFRPWLKYNHSILTRISSESSDFKELFKDYLKKK